MPDLSNTNNNFSSSNHAVIAQASVHGDKRSGKDALAEERLQEVWNLKSAAESIRSVGIPEVMGKHPFAYQPDEAAEQNAGTDSKCGGA